MEPAGDLTTDRGLDRDLFDVLTATSPDGLDGDSARLREHVLRDFRRSGVDQPEEVRERLRTMTHRCTELGLAFSRRSATTRAPSGSGPTSWRACPRPSAGSIRLTRTAWWR